MPICSHLASQGDYLLLAGAEDEHLANLDASLSQPELHRYMARTAGQPWAETLATWLAAEAPRLSGAVLVPDPCMPPHESPIFETLEGSLGFWNTAAAHGSVVVVLARPAWCQSWPAWEGAVSANRFGVWAKQWQQQVEHWATPLASRQIRVNLVLAGPFADSEFSARLEETARQTDICPAQMRAQLCAQVRLGALVQSDDLAATTATWLGSSTKHSTGQVVRVGTVDFT